MDNDIKEKIKDIKDLLNDLHAAVTTIENDDIKEEILNYLNDTEEDLNECLEDIKEYDDYEDDYDDDNYEDDYDEEE